MGQLRLGRAWPDRRSCRLLELLIARERTRDQVLSGTFVMSIEALERGEVGAAAAAVVAAPGHGAVLRGGSKAPATRPAATSLLPVSPLRRALGDDHRHHDGREHDGEHRTGKRCWRDLTRPDGGLRHKRLMGFEPTTFCMASRRSSQLSYSRAWRDSSLVPRASARARSSLTRRKRPRAPLTVSLATRPR
jgi:hypothetical protein